MIGEKMFFAPVADWEVAENIVSARGGAGARVGFTNGCFDILHIGHATYLSDARAQCDFLVVGLNVDSSIRRLKGETRPVNPFDARAGLLSALRCVDLVVPFGEGAEEGDTPVALIKRLRPALYFKGGDYTRETLPETPVVESYGGRVVILPLVDGYSTSATIAKVSQNP